jgi:hypothetical protein
VNVDISYRRKRGKVADEIPDLERESD